MICVFSNWVRCILFVESKWIYIHTEILLAPFTDTIFFTHLYTWCNWWIIFSFGQKYFIFFFTKHYFTSFSFIFKVSKYVFPLVKRLIKKHWINHTWDILSICIHTFYTSDQISFFSLWQKVVKWKCITQVNAPIILFMCESFFVFTYIS